MYHITKETHMLEECKAQDSCTVAARLYHFDTEDQAAYALAMFESKAYKDFAAVKADASNELDESFKAFVGSKGLEERTSTPLLADFHAISSEFLKLVTASELSEEEKAYNKRLKQLAKEASERYGIAFENLTSEWAFETVAAYETGGFVNDVFQTGVALCGESFGKILIGLAKL